MLNLILVLLIFAFLYAIRGKRENRKIGNNILAALILGFIIVGILINFLPRETIKISKINLNVAAKTEESKPIKLEPDHCKNGETDGDESDEDCGGSCLEKCNLHQSCNINADCKNYACIAKVCSPWFKIIAPGCSIAVFSDGGKITWYKDDGLGVASRPEKNESAALVYCKKGQSCTVRTDYTEGRFVPCEPSRQGKNKFFVLWNYKGE